ncbi:Na+/H+ antiporter subunit E [Streptomyces fumigatiscleroticus]|nr:Na+/H+ antiporter subunit E [Streptomyces fumigatiscleroticus]
MRFSWSVPVGPAGPRRRPVQLPVVVWLAVLWTLLWGEVTAANLLTGALAGVFITLAFPMPPLDTRVRPRPLGIARLLLWFAGDLVGAAFRVSAQILSPGALPCAVLAVPLRVRSDLLLTVTTVMVSAVPGSTVVEIRRATSSLYLHVLGADGEEAMDRSRREVSMLEQLVVRALGTAEQIASLDDAEDGGRRP